MTDNEIIKAFKDFLIEQVDGYTDHVETGGERYEFIEKELELLKETDNLINRQKAEIERLTAERDAMHQDVIAAEEYAWQCKTAKVEAYKEFAERSEKEIFIKQDDERKQMLKILKTYRGTRTYSDTEQATDNWLRGYGEAVQDVLCVFNNLLKEMEREQ